MWTLYLRNPAMEREGQVDDFESFDAVARFNSVGTWTLTLDGRAPLAAKLQTPGYGIELVRDDVTTVVTGPMRSRRLTQDGDVRKVTISGTDDLLWLKLRLAHPEPSTPSPGPYNTSQHDIRTGIASTVLRAYVHVNAGMGALLPRRVPGFGLAADPLIGSTITGRARWQNLLTITQELAVAGGNLGFRVEKAGASLGFHVYQPFDRTGTVKLSSELGTLYGFEATADAADMTYVYAGGGGEGTARVIREGENGADGVAWGRAEAFVDRRDTTIGSELDQEILKALNESAGKTGIRINPVDIPDMKFLVDYNLGDRITCVIDGVETREVVREAQISLKPQGPQQTVPVLSSTARTEVLGIFRRMRSFEGRLANLERR